MSALGLKVGDKRIVVNPLVSTRAVSAVKVVCRGRSVWALNAKGQVFRAAVGDLRKRQHRWEDATELTLTDDDIFALGALGLIDAKATAKLKDEALYRRDYQRRKKWLEGDVEAVRDAGIGLATGWQEKIELKAISYARKEQASRRKRATSLRVGGAK